MRIGAGQGLLELRLVGCQFPLGPCRRPSGGYFVQGRAVTAAGAKEIPVMPVPGAESALLGSWLAQVADAVDGLPVRGGRPLPAPHALGTVLGLEVVPTGRTGHAVEARVDLDPRVAASWRTWRGFPMQLRLRTSSEQLRAAAAEWAEDVRRFPLFAGPEHPTAGRGRDGRPEAVRGDDRTPLSA